MALTGAFVVFISIFLIAVFTILFFMKQKDRNPPYLITYILIGMFLVHWVLYGSGTYATFPDISSIIFLPIWFVLCGWGFITGGIEYKNNTNAAILIWSLSLFSTLFGLFLQGLSRM